MKHQRLLAHHRTSKPFHQFVPIVSFVNDQMFVTKLGDYGAVLSLKGIDDECLTNERLEVIASALVSALKLFGERFRIYQYLIKDVGVEIPRLERYPNQVVEEVVCDRIAFLKEHAALGSAELYLVVSNLKDDRG